jgi:hypothetical protein
LSSGPLLLPTRRHASELSGEGQDHEHFGHRAVCGYVVGLGRRGPRPGHRATRHAAHRFLVTTPRLYGRVYGFDNANAREANPREANPRNAYSIGGSPAKKKRIARIAMATMKAPRIQAT